MKMFVSILLMFSLLIFSSNPMLMILLIILQTLTYSSIMMFTMNLNFTPLILILIFLGGLLIIFMYMVSISPIMKFKFMNYIPLLILFSVIQVMLLKVNNIIPLMNMKLNFKFKEVNYFADMYNDLLYWSTVFIAIFLIVMLILIVMILKMNKLPLRKK